MNCLCLSKEVNEKQLASLLGNYFDIDVECISFTDDIVNCENNSKFIVVIKMLSGDFPLWLDLYSFPKAEDIDLAEYIVEPLNVDILVSDSSRNPYSWILAGVKGRSSVLVDAEYLDNFNGFKISA